MSEAAFGSLPFDTMVRVFAHDDARYDGSVKIRQLGNIERQEIHDNLKSSKWLNGYYRVDLPDILNEITYDWAWDFEISYLRQECTVTIWDGTLVHGDRTTRRAEWIFSFPPEGTVFNGVIKNNMKKNLLRMADEKYEEELREARNRAIYRIAISIATEVK